MIVFTICSNNYLGYAKTLCESLIRSCSVKEVIVFICDTENNLVDYKNIKGCHLVFLNQLDISDIESMLSQYTVIEMNTALKPFAFKWCLENYSDEFILFLDPDTYVTGNLSSCVEELGQGNLLLTPHILSPIPRDEHTPQEDLFTQYGIYNLGFLLLRRSADALMFLRWWSERMRVNCYARAHRGVFVDQLPMNFAPLFFQGVVISRNAGLNVAPWNNHERSLINRGGEYYLKGGSPLIFYHFSNYQQHNHKGQTHPAYNRHPVHADDVLSSLYREYTEHLVKNEFQSYKAFPPAFRPDAGSRGLSRCFRGVFERFDRLKTVFKKRA